MSPDTQFSYYWQLLGVLLISLLSGFISVGRRMLRQNPPPILWVLSEFVAAILAGYLGWGAYPDLRDSLPRGVTMPVFIAVCAHFGGRFFQLSESYLEGRLQNRPNDP